MHPSLEPLETPEGFKGRILGRSRSSVCNMLSPPGGQGVLRDDVPEEDGVDAHVKRVDRVEQLLHAEIPLSFDIVIAIDEGQELGPEILLAKSHGFHDGPGRDELPLIILGDADCQAPSLGPAVEFHP